MIKVASFSVLMLCATLAGCGMRSVLDGYNDGQPLSVADAGTKGGAGSGAVGTPCGHGGTCDPENLDGETCALLGAGGGTLSCDPQTCTFDLSMCSGVRLTTGTGTGTGTGTNGQGGTSGGFTNGGQGGTTGGFMNGGQGGTTGGFMNGGQGGTTGGFMNGGTGGTTGGFFGGGGQAGAGTGGRGGRAGRGGTGGSTGGTGGTAGGTAGAGG